MDEQEFKSKTKRVGLEAIRLVEQLPNSRTADVLSRQLLRAATAVGANYRAACRGKSGADVIAKLSIVEEEADEVLYWLEVLTEANCVSRSYVAGLMADTDEVLAMIVASIKTLRNRSLDAKSGIRVVQSKIQNPKSKIC